MNEAEMSVILERLPWYQDLSLDSRERMVVEMLLRTQDPSDLGTRDAFVKSLLYWRDVAYTDVKWARFDMLLEVGDL